MRIVSLLPSCTETVCALDCAGSLVGRSHECDYPEEIRPVPVCTSSRVDAGASSAGIDRQIKSLLQRALSIYEIDAARFRDLRPDIILTQAQCEVCAVSLADLEKALPPSLAGRVKVISVAPQRLADVWKDMQTIADTLDASQKGREMLSELKGRVVDVIQKSCMVKKRPTVACLDWMEPLMAAGHWVPEMADLAGGRDLFGVPGRPSAWLEWKNLAAADPDVIVLMPCGIGLDRARREAAALEAQPEWRTLRAVKSKNVFVTDGNHYFNRPGPRVAESVEILAGILHPKLFTFGNENRSWARL